MFQSTWRKSSPASYLRKSANSTDEPRRVERRSPRIVPGKARRVCMRNRSSFLRKAGSSRLSFSWLIDNQRELAGKPVSTVFSKRFTSFAKQLPSGLEAVFDRRFFRLPASGGL